MCSLLDVNYTIFLHNRNIITVRFQFLNPAIIFTVSSEIRVAYFDQIDNRYLKHISSPWNLLNLHGYCDRHDLPSKKQCLSKVFILFLPVVALVAKLGKYSIINDFVCLPRNGKNSTIKGAVSSLHPCPINVNGNISQLIPFTTI